MGRRTPTEVWKDVSGDDGDATDDDMEAILAMTPEDRRRELEKAGFDLERFHAEADAKWDPPAEPTRLRPRAARRVVFATATALAIAAGAAIVVHVRPPGDVVGSAPDDSRAAALRKQARDACAARDRKTCLAKLDEAKALDPAGDEAPDVQSLRKSATGP